MRGWQSEHWHCSSVYCTGWWRINTFDSVLPGEGSYDSPYIDWVQDQSSPGYTEGDKWVTLYIVHTSIRGLYSVFCSHLFMTAWSKSDIGRYRGWRKGASGSVCGDIGIESYYQNTHSINCIPFCSVTLRSSILFLWNCCMLLALPISPRLMDGFWCSRCLKDHIKVSNMMKLFSGGATTPLVVKIWTKQP